MNSFFPWEGRAGPVTTIGSQVKNFKPGDRGLVPGGCVEQVLVDSQQATLLPSNLTWTPQPHLEATI
ncbi:MAG: hypothetical protein CM1200mP24_04080 [Gammaproteobacteria bacterium]|nr:MAG: hypothetical protein CM1200mP24_04080 [Gammaproteobacteria bacterium]